MIAHRPPHSLTSPYTSLHPYVRSIPAQAPKKMLIDLLKYMDVDLKLIKPVMNETLRAQQVERRPGPGLRGQGF